MSAPRGRAAFGLRGRPHVVRWTHMQDIPAEQSLIEYPSRFPIKVMGANVDGFVHAVTEIARRFDPASTPRRSSCGRAAAASTSA